MRDAIETNCTKCSQKQKEGSDKLIGYLIDNKPNYWKPLQEKYDSSGNYTFTYLQMKSKTDSGTENN